MKVSLSLDISLKGATGIFDSFELDPEYQNGIAFEVQRLLYNALNLNYNYEKYEVKVTCNKKATSSSSQQLD